MFSLLRTSTATAARRTFSTSQARADVARIVLVGVMGTDPEVAQLPDGREVMRYTIGVSRGAGKPTSWFRVANFNLEERGGKEYLATLPKGSLVYFEGDISLNVRETEEGRKFTEYNIFQHSISALRRAKERPIEEE